MQFISWYTNRAMVLLLQQLTKYANQKVLSVYHEEAARIFMFLLEQNQIIIKTRTFSYSNESIYPE